MKEIVSVVTLYYDNPRRLTQVRCQGQLLSLHASLQGADRSPGGPDRGGEMEEVKGWQGGGVAG